MDTKRQELLLKIEDQRCIVGFSKIEDRKIDHPELVGEFIDYLEENFSIKEAVLDLRETSIIYNDVKDIVEALEKYKKSLLVNCNNKDSLTDYQDTYGDIVIPVEDSPRLKPIQFEISDMELCCATHSTVEDKDEWEDVELNRKSLNLKISEKYLHDSLSSFLNITIFNERFSVVPCHGMATYDLKMSKNQLPVRPMRYSPSKNLADDIIAFEKLLNIRGLKESNIQEFIEEYPHIMRGLFPDGARIYPHLSLNRTSKGLLIPDFFVQPFGQEFLEIVDLKLPTKQLVVETKNRNHFSQAVVEGIAQLREYSSYFDDEKNRSNFTKSMEKYGAFDEFNCYKPMSTLVIGFDENWKNNPSILREKRTSYSDINVVTYDELIKTCRNRLLI